MDHTHYRTDTHDCARSVVFLSRFYTDSLSFQALTTSTKQIFGNCYFLHGSFFHHASSGFTAQGGYFTTGVGTGVSIYGTRWKFTTRYILRHLLICLCKQKVPFFQLLYSTLMVALYACVANLKKSTIWFIIQTIQLQKPHNNLIES